jgi:hypothetical protein
MVAYAMHLLRTEQTKEVRIHPDSIGRTTQSPRLFVAEWMSAVFL